MNIAVHQPIGGLPIEKTASTRHINFAMYIANHDHDPGHLGV